MLLRFEAGTGIEPVIIPNDSGYKQRARAAKHSSLQ